MRARMAFHELLRNLSLKEVAASIVATPAATVVVVCAVFFGAALVIAAIVVLVFFVISGILSSFSCFGAALVISGILSSFSWVSSSSQCLLRRPLRRRRCS